MKKLLNAMLSILIAFSICSINADAVYASEDWNVGPSAYMHMQDDGNAIISGTGAVTSMAATAMSNAQNNGLIVKNITFREDANITEIGDSAFVGRIYLESITLPNTITKIGISAFENCIGLTSLSIPNSVTSIG